ncbi:MAG TPA: methyltransferase domain-containing protein, partial [Blastocatellia bacterium]|nr:methyltransferase domain-containing protein [Blastocatellia bacterium]
IAEIIWAGGAEFIARLQLTPGTRVLDVACGTGNLSFPAAQAGSIVTGVDIATNLLETARARAEAEGASIQFDEGDAEALPYADASFDEVVTMFGAMFAPRPTLVASELARVCRSGGRLAMANWTPEGFIGQVFKATGKHVPPPSIMPSPLMWGSEAIIAERLGDAFTNLQCTRRILYMNFPMTPADAVEYFRAWYGPTNRAFATLDDAGQAALRRDLEQVWTEHNCATDGTTSIPAEYLEVIATRA